MVRQSEYNHLLRRNQELEAMMVDYEIAIQRLETELARKNLQISNLELDKAASMFKISTLYEKYERRVDEQRPDFRFNFTNGGNYAKSG